MIHVALLGFAVAVAVAAVAVALARSRFRLACLELELVRLEIQLEAAKRPRTISEAVAELAVACRPGGLPMIIVSPTIMAFLIRTELFEDPVPGGIGPYRMYTPTPPRAVWITTPAGQVQVQLRPEPPETERAA